MDTFLSYLETISKWQDPVSWMMSSYSMMTRFCSKKNYEQTGTKAKEIDSHHCLYCDTTFPQFDDLIKHSWENHPYHFVTIMSTRWIRFKVFNFQH
jgi:ferredoxin-like protein FixX